MTNPLKYRPPSISQRDTLLSRDGIDDCRVVATALLVASGTAGEAFLSDRGIPLGRLGRVKLCVRMRNSLPASRQAGGLHSGDTRMMIANIWPEIGQVWTSDINFAELKKFLDSGWAASLSGVPSRISGPSPLKRAGNVGHEFFLERLRSDGKILVYDPFREHTGSRGEARPAGEVRQFAYKSSDKDLTSVIVVKKGSWTAEALMRKKKNKSINKLTEQLESLTSRVENKQKKINALRDMLEERPDQPVPVDFSQLRDLLEAGKEDVEKARRSVVDSLIELGRLEDET